MPEARTPPAPDLFASLRARPLLSALLLLAAIVFCYRGVIRTFDYIDDFELLWLQARTWLYGGDPYDWHDPLMAIPAGFFTDSPRWLVYPPPTLAILSPFGALPWELASSLYILLSVLLYGAMVAAIGAWYRVFQEPSRALVFLIGALVMYPIHTALSEGQAAVPAAALMILSLYAELDRARPRTAAWLGALALCLKPHVGGVAIGYFVLSRRFETVLRILVITAGIALIGILPLVLSGTWTWIAGYVQHQPAMLVLGQEAPDRAFDLIVLDLSNILRFLGANDTVLTMIRALTALAVLGLWWSAFGRDPDVDHRLAVLPILVLSLLPVYHKPYDGFVVLPLFAWLTMVWGRRPWWQTVPVALALLPFMQPVPTTALVALWHFRQSNPLRDGAPWLWNVLIVPHATWALLFLAVVLCLIPGRRESGPAKEGVP